MRVGFHGFKPRCRVSFEVGVDLEFVFSLLEPDFAEVLSVGIPHLVDAWRPAQVAAFVPQGGRFDRVEEIDAGHFGVCTFVFT